MTDTFSALPKVDDCWNRIGIRGDKSCPQLVEHVHCRNCPVYANAARRLLDRFPPQDRVARDDAPRGMQETSAQGPMLTILVFRLEREWLALPTGALDEVTSVRTIHSLPHRLDEAVLGVVNVRGSLTVCVSLARLLGLEAALPSESRERAGAPRMLLIGGAGRAVVLPVDEVDGIHSVSADTMGALPATVQGSTSKYSRGVVRCGSRSVGVLDDVLLMHALERSLA